MQRGINAFWLVIDKGCKILKSERKGKYVSFIPYTDVVKKPDFKWI